MDAEQKAQIKTEFLKLKDHPAMDIPGALSAIIDGVIDESEKDRLRREQFAKQKTAILRMEDLPAPTNNPCTKENPLGLNPSMEEPKAMHMPKLGTKAQREKFMQELIRSLYELEQMGTNDTTNVKNWYIEGASVGEFARKMRNRLFPQQTKVKGKQKPNRKRVTHE